MEQDRLTGVTFLAICWLIGILLGNLLNIPFFYLLIVLILIIPFAISTRMRLYALLLLTILLGMARISVPKPQDHISHLFEAESVFNRVVEGRIISDATASGSRYRYEFELHEIADVSINGKLLLFTEQDSLVYGDLIRGRATLHGLQRASNPGQIGLDEYYSIRGIDGSAIASHEMAKIGRWRGLNGHVIVPVRRWMVRRIEERFGKSAGFVRNITLGMVPRGEGYVTVFRDAGLAHLLAVSGLHTGLIAMVLYALLVVAIPNRKIASLILIGILVFYAALCAWKAPVTRATIMISLYLLSRVIQRRPLRIHILALAAIVITAIAPRQLFSAGFQLSFASILVLLSSYPFLEEHIFSRVRISRKNIPGQFVLWVFRLVLASLLITLSLAPFTLYYFHTLNLNSVVSNLVGIPMLSLILPMSLLIVFLPDVSWLIDIYRSAFDLLLGVMQRFTAFSARLPLRVDNIGFSEIQLVGGLLLVMAALIVFHKNYRWAIPAALVGAVFFMHPMIHSQQRLRITCFDCGNADMALIEAPGATFMIDTGPDDETRGTYLHSARGYFRECGIKRLDAVFITHEHQDHYGGYESIKKDVAIERLYAPDEFFEADIGKQFLRNTGDTEIFVVRDTMRLELGEAKLSILHPAEDYSSDTINNHSMVIRIDYGDFSALFTADIHADLETVLVERFGERLDADFLKVAHHGSETSSNQNFIECVRPEYAFISCTVGDQRKLPDEVVLDRFAFLQENLAISGIDGALVIETDGKTADYRTILTEKTTVDHDLTD